MSKNEPINKPLDSFDFIAVYGDLGHLKGYASGLLRRITQTDLPVEEDDISYVGQLIDQLEKSLDKALGYEEELS